jgi:hypothetical protein
MANIKIGAKNLTVTLEPLQALASLKSTFEIAGSEVRGAQVVDKSFWRTLGMRSPGTAVPGAILAGTYRRRGDRTFVYWTRSTTPIQLNLDGTGTYNRVIIGIQGTKADAEALADRINMAITGC